MGKPKVNKGRRRSFNNKASKAQRLRRLREVANKVLIQDQNNCSESRTVTSCQEQLLNSQLLPDTSKVDENQSNIFDGALSVSENSAFIVPPSSLLTNSDPQMTVLKVSSTEQCTILPESSNLQLVIPRVTYAKQHTSLPGSSQTPLNNLSPLCPKQCTTLSTSSHTPKINTSSSPAAEQCITLLASSHTPQITLSHPCAEQCTSLPVNPPTPLITTSPPCTEKCTTQPASLHTKVIVSSSPSAIQSTTLQGSLHIPLIILRPSSVELCEKIVASLPNAILSNCTHPPIIIPSASSANLSILLSGNSNPPLNVSKESSAKQCTTVTDSSHQQTTTSKSSNAKQPVKGIPSKSTVKTETKKKCIKKINKDSKLSSKIVDKLPEIHFKPIIFQSISLPLSYFTKINESVSKKEKCQDSGSFKDGVKNLNLNICDSTLDTVKDHVETGANLCNSKTSVKSKNYSPDNAFKSKPINQNKENSTDQSKNELTEVGMNIEMDFEADNYSAFSVLDSEITQLLF